MLGVACRQDLHLPALECGIALIHPEQVAGEQRRLVAAGAGPDLDDDIALVGGVLGQQQQAESLLRLADPDIEHRALVLGQRLELAVAGLRQHFLDFRPLALQRVQGPGGPDDRLELGIFLGQSDKGIARRPARQCGLDHRKTVIEPGNFLISDRNHRSSARPTERPQQVKSRVLAETAVPAKHRQTGRRTCQPSVKSLRSSDRPTRISPGLPSWPLSIPSIE